MSVYGDACDMKKGTVFRNVNDSTGDPPINGWGWIELWENKTGLKRGKCCVCGDNAALMVGGHIVLGSGNSYGDASTETSSLFGGNRVFIAPICSSCNGKAGIFRSVFSTRIVHLCGYGVDSRFDEGKYSYAHPELSLDELRTAIAQKQVAYDGYLYQTYNKQRVLHGRDQQILDMAVPSLASVSSRRY